MFNRVISALRVIIKAYCWKQLGKKNSKERRVFHLSLSDLEVVTDIQITILFSK